MKIIVYSKTGCPWATRMFDFLKQRGIDFENRDMIANPEFAGECKQKAGECKSPTVEIDGKIIRDADVKDVQKYLDSVGMKAA